MQAEIISVGTELLLGDIIDTNAAYLSKVLAELGIDLKRRVTVGDNGDRIQQAVAEALGRADVVITIGGLGPTEDDITKEATAAAIGVQLLPDEGSAKRIREHFARRKLAMTERNLKQAVRPASGFAIPNHVGTAPGAVFEKDGKAVICLPGPPNEFEPMAEEVVRSYLRGRQGRTATIIVSRVLKLCGIGESQAEEKVRDLLHADNPTIAPLAQLGEVHFRVTAKAADAEDADRLISEAERKLRERIGCHVYGVDSTTLEQAVVELLKQRAETLALAESCTGGLVSNRVTNVSGSSEVFMGGVVAYSNDLKIRLLNVPKSLIDEHGAVSSQVARAMATGVRKAARSDIGIGITGIAGPTGGTPEKPVGLVYIGLSHAAEDRPTSEEFCFVGARTDIKQRTSQAALTMLWETLAGHKS